MYKAVLETEINHSSALAELAQLAYDLRDDAATAKALFQRATQQKGTESSGQQPSISLPSARTLTMFGKFLADTGDISNAEAKFKAVSAVGMFGSTAMVQPN